MTRVERWQAIEARAVALIAAIDRNLETRPWPWKYGVPFGEALALRQALDTPARDDLTGRIPPGPRAVKQ